MKAFKLRMFWFVLGSAWVALSAATTTLAGEVDRERLAEIPRRMQQFVDVGEISGAVTLVALDGQIIHLEAVGLADIEADRPMQKDTIFRIASMTKPISATAVMILAEEGKLSIDDPVSKYIPSFGNVTLKESDMKPVITIRHLITHTAGLDRPERREGEPRPNWTLEETADRLAALPLKFEPGTSWEYSSGVTICGRIIEVVSGKPYDVFVGERILGPLGMNDTTFEPDSAQRARTAKVYQPSEEDGSLVVSKRLFTSEPGAKRTPSPSGGLYSTATDMARFYQMILNGGEIDGKRIISESSVKAMITNQTGDLAVGFTPVNCWGLGWCIVRKPSGVTGMLSPGTFGHGGAYGTQGWVDPERRAIFVLMIQGSELGNTDASPMRFVLQELGTSAID